jgi:hypothetical protein
LNGPSTSPSIQIVAHTVPCTTSPLRMPVMATRRAPAALATVTVWETVKVCPAPSRTVRLRVWAPSATVAVFQLNVVLVSAVVWVKISVPSTRRV